MRGDGIRFSLESGHFEQLDGLFNALQQMATSRDGLDARAEEQCIRRARHEDFAGTCSCGHTRCEVNGYAADVIADELDFAGVHSGALPEIHRHGHRGELERAVDRVSRAVEDGNDTVAGRAYLAAVVFFERPLDPDVVLREAVAPSAVANLRGELRRVDEVSEQDRRQPTVGRCVPRAGVVATTRPVDRNPCLVAYDPRVVPRWTFEDVACLRVE